MGIMGSEKNKLICIGITGNMICYLNIPEDEAVRRYSKDNDMSEEEVRSGDFVRTECIEFEDNFWAYSVTELI